MYLGEENKMTQKNEKIFLAVISGYFFAIFSIVVFGIVIATQTSDSMPVEVVTVHGNKTTKDSVVITDAPPLSTSFAAVFSNFSFVFPFILAGVGVWLPWISIMSGQLPTPHETSVLVLSFWILSMVSIPITIKLSKGIPMWRRIPYIYLVAVLIGGTAIWLWTGFGN